MSDIVRANQKAKAAGINAVIKPSGRKGKRFVAEFPDGTKTHFGDVNAKYTYLDKKDEQKRKAYIARHSQIYTKSGRRAIDVPKSAAQLSLRILWT
jgi:hypothetical protein